MMLKIKDSIDLKELENYGFRYSLGEDWHYYFDNISLSLGDEREIIIDFNSDDYCETEMMQLMSLLYDLIKVDLVEKVGDE